MENKGLDKSQNQEIKTFRLRDKEANYDDFVLEKSIFSNIFEKDIKRVYIYKKAERLAKAIHLVAPAFADSASLRERLDAIAIGLVDAAIRPPGAARTALSRELLALSSVLSIARTGGLLSGMNADLIGREAHLLLQEVAAYEEPRLFLENTPSLAEIARSAARNGRGADAAQEPSSARASRARSAPIAKGRSEEGAQVKRTNIKDRTESVLSVIREKAGPTNIKDISTVIRGVSEKTIQRELQALVAAGLIHKEGNRRWSIYTLAADIH